MSKKRQIFDTYLLSNVDFFDSAVNNTNDVLQVVFSKKGKERHMYRENETFTSLAFTASAYLSLSHSPSPSLPPPPPPSLSLSPHLPLTGQ